MRLSPAAEFAVRGVSVLARRYGDGPVTLDAICAERELSKQYMTKIFLSLTRAGVIKPVRGKGGGYLLSREPARVTLLEVIEAVQGPVMLNFCTHDPPECDRGGCPMRPLWRQLQKDIRRKLGTVNFARFRPARKTPGKA